MVTSRYFAAETLSSSKLCRVYLVLKALMLGNVENLNLNLNDLLVKRQPDKLAFRRIKLHITRLFPFCMLHPSRL